MPSWDKRMSIERYPEYNKKGELINVSFGICIADSSRAKDSMGYTDINILLKDLRKKILNWRIKRKRGKSWIW